VKSAYFVMMGRVVEAIQRARPHVLVPCSKQCVHVLQFLYREGYIRGYEKINNKTLKIYFKFLKGKPLIHMIKIHTKPSREVSVSYRSLRQTNVGSSICVISTKHGLCSLSDLLYQNTVGKYRWQPIGGIMLFSFRV
jgi:small subunit ribosomal protein S8